MKGVGQVEEIAQDLPAVLARDALRVELHAECRTVTMLNPHDEAFVALGADFELSRRTRTFNDERVIARRRKGSVQTAEETTRIMRNARHFAVHRRWRAHDLAAKRLPDRLMAE